MVVRRFGLPVRVLAGVVALVVSLGVLAGVPGLWPVPGAHAAPVSTTDNPYVKPTDPVKPEVPTAGATVQNRTDKRGILLNDTVQRQNVYSVTFLDNQDGLSDDKTVERWDAGAPANGSTTPTDAVKGWAKLRAGNQGLYDVFFGTKTKGTYPSLPANSSHLFDGFNNLTAIKNLNKVNTSNVTDMSYMFSDSVVLSNLDVSHFDTSNVTNMEQMFSGCSKELSSVDVSRFNTSKVMNMERMFENCSKLSSVDVSRFNTSNVTDMSFMFQNCSGLSNLDVSHFDTSNVTNMGYMFSGCLKLSSVDVSHFDTSKVTNMYYMFQNCSGLSSLDVSGFNTSNVTSMEHMFDGCSGLSNLDVSHFDTPKVTSMSSMFQNCSGLSLLDLRSFNTDGVLSKTSALAGLTKLNELRLGANFTLKGSEMGLDQPDQSAMKAGYTNFKDRQWHNAKTEAAVTNVAGEGVYTTFRPNAYTVHFDGNAPEGATVTGSMAEQSFKYDQALTALSANGYQCAGYTFVRWSTQQDGVGDGSYTDKAEVQNLTVKDADTVNLYAQWKANSYTVRFEAGANDATGRMADQSFTYGVKQALSANVFVRTGYTFAGWKVKNSVSMLDADPSAGVYEDEAEVQNLTADADGVVTLVAQWTKNAEPVKPSEPSTPSNPSKPSKPSGPSAPSSPSASGSGTASADATEVVDLAATGVSVVPAVLVALVLAGVGVVIGMLRKRS